MTRELLNHGGTKAPDLLKEGYSWGSVAHSQVAGVPGFWQRP